VKPPARRLSKAEKEAAQRIALDDNLANRAAASGKGPSKAQVEAITRIEKRKAEEVRRLGEDCVSGEWALNARQKREAKRLQKQQEASEFESEIRQRVFDEEAKQRGDQREEIEQCKEHARMREMGDEVFG